MLTFLLAILTMLLPQPMDSRSDDPAMRGPEGGFLIPCAEDEVPTVISDPEALFPPGVWYECTHIDSLP